MCSILWIVLFIVVIVIIVKEVKEGFGFDKQKFAPVQTNLDDLATKPLATYPRDSIDVLADGTFKPECCLLSPYSNQDGCLCPSSKDAGLIIARGGNH